MKANSETGTRKGQGKASPPRQAQKTEKWLALQGNSATLWTRASVLCLILEEVFYAGFAFFAARGLTSLIKPEQQDKQVFFVAFLWAIFFIALKALLHFGSVWAGFQASQQVRLHIGALIAKFLLKQGPKLTRCHETGVLHTALLDDVEALSGYYNRYRPFMMALGPATLVLILASAVVSWKAAVFFFATVSCLPLFLTLTGLSAQRASRRQFHVLSRLAGLFHDRMTALPMLKSFGAVKTQEEVLARRAEDFRRKTMSVLRFAFLSSATLELLSALSLVLILIYVALPLIGSGALNQQDSHHFQQGLFLLMLAPEFYIPFRRLASAYHDRVSAVSAGEKLLDLLHTGETQDHTLPSSTSFSTGSTPSEQSESDKDGIPWLRFDHVVSRYEDGRYGLKGLTLDIPARCVTVLAGSSGSGKSTALNSLMGFAPISQGKIFWQGRELKDFQEIRRHTAWCSQTPYLFYGSVKEAIGFGNPDASEEDIRAIAHKLGLQDLTGEKGSEDSQSRGGHGLSGGQAQRVALGRALLKLSSSHLPANTTSRTTPPVPGSPLLLLDEPTAFLDAGAEQDFLTYLRKYLRDYTVVIASHKPAVFDLAHHLAWFEDGVVMKTEKRQA